MTLKELIYNIFKQHSSEFKDEDIDFIYSALFDRLPQSDIDKLDQLSNLFDPTNCNMTIRINNLIIEYYDYAGFEKAKAWHELDVIDKLLFKLLSNFNDDYRIVLKYKVIYDKSAWTIQVLDNNNYKCIINITDYYLSTVFKDFVNELDI